MEESLGQRMRRLRGEEREAAIRDVISRWRESGQSQAAFCSEIGIATVTLARWLRKLEAAKAPKWPEPVLVEVGVQDDGHEEVYDVVLANGVCVSVPAGFRESELVRLLRVLSSTC